MCIGVSTHQKHYLLFFIKRPLQTAQAPPPPPIYWFFMPLHPKNRIFQWTLLSYDREKKNCFINFFVIEYLYFM